MSLVLKYLANIFSVSRGLVLMKWSPSATAWPKLLSNSGCCAITSSRVTTAEWTKGMPNWARSAMTLNPIFFANSSCGEVSSVA
jgi:hypothetical protein